LARERGRSGRRDGAARRGARAQLAAYVRAVALARTLTLRVHEREGLAPVALPREEPVAKLVVDLRGGADNAPRASAHRAALQLTVPRSCSALRACSAHTATEAAHGAATHGAPHCTTLRATFPGPSGLAPHGHPPTPACGPSPRPPAIPPPPAWPAGAHTELLDDQSTPPCHIFPAKHRHGHCARLAYSASPLPVAARYTHQAPTATNCPLPLPWAARRC
jgi:hypothetical protein